MRTYSFNLSLCRNLLAMFLSGWMVWLSIFVHVCNSFWRYSEDILGVQWVAEFAALAGSQYPSINVWAEKSSSSGDTINIFFWLGYLVFITPFFSHDGKPL